LAERGADVTLLARNQEKLDAVLQELLGDGHANLCADFDDPESVRTAVAEVIKGGQIFTILINNSGGPPSGKLLDASPEDFNTAFSRHIVCNQILAQQIIPGMVQSNFGRIINIISTSVRKPIQGLGVSNTIRAAVANWARSLAMDVGAAGITVNNVLPGYTDTDRLKSLIVFNAKGQNISEEDARNAMIAGVPLGRLAEPVEQANLIAFLASEAASYISGTSIAVDGGRT
jgi:3-oxoacyl-[acyl-carrier protein] reductase